MANLHSLVKFSKGILYPKGEPYVFGGKKLYFMLGSRPIRRKYLASNDDVVRNDVLQIEYFEKEMKPNDVLWDIGSHNGHYSIFGASVAAGTNQVFSFEPDIVARGVQMQNIAANKFQDRIKVFDLAVSNFNGYLNFKSTGGNSTSHIAKGAEEAEADVVKIPTKTLNTLLQEIPAPSFVKIDTEGAEIDILSEGSELLKNPGIRFICELHPFAWPSFGVRYEQFQNILNTYNRKLELLDPKKKKSDLPYYGTVLF